MKGILEQAFKVPDHTGALTPSPRSMSFTEKTPPVSFTCLLCYICYNMDVVMSLGIDINKYCVKCSHARESSKSSKSNDDEIK